VLCSPAVRDPRGAKSATGLSADPLASATKRDPMQHSIKIFLTSRQLFLWLCFIVAFIQVSCKSSIGPESRYNVPSSDYLFVEHHVHRAGVLISGEKITGPLIDGPGYSFDSSSGVLHGNIGFPIEDNLIAVCGDGGSLSGTVGGGVATYLLAICDLPYQHEEGNPILKDIRKDGTILVSYRDSSITLIPGDEWVSITTEIDTLPTAIVQVTTTDMLTNFGFQLKSKIQKY
jgi:hypothetical protein